MTQNMHGIPPVHRFLSDDRIARFEPLAGRDGVKRAVDAVLERARGVANGATYEALAQAVASRLHDDLAQSLIRVINATGVLLHTNLGRAPLAMPAIDAVAGNASGYSNLEFDLKSGSRSSRYARASGVLRSLTGAQDILVVNNCAAALLLVVDTFAKGRDAIVSRGELIEIGGGFRLPDVLRSSGARLIEAGSTNKTTIRDFERALSPSAGLILKSHTSNYRIDGFTQSPASAEIAALAKRTGVLFAEDLGSGAVCDLRDYGLAHERTVQEALADADLVTFSGDKLFGGPQAGIVAGKAAAIARMRANPLLRALRVDKMTLAALTETARLHLSAQSRAEIPLYGMLGTPLDTLSRRATRFVAALPAFDIVETRAYAGGGSLPGEELPSIALRLRGGDADAKAAALRRQSPPVVGRVEDGALLLDLRTVLPEEDEQLLAVLRTA